MSGTTSTRESLLLRLHNETDTEAWSQFVEIYSPLLFRFGRRYHCTEAEAADMVQDVMGEVFKSIGKFEYDPKIGKFRNWLLRIAKRRLWRMREKQSRQPRSPGDTSETLLFENAPDKHDDLQRYWDDEYQQHLVRWGIEQIKHSFEEHTWNAFWMTAIEERPVAEVAAELGMSTGAVYVAKSRALKKLGEEIRKIDDTQ
ncbi:MAG: sigma-70 family RNA polymerase sigma factor [Planctomycetota bacterium]